MKSALGFDVRELTKGMKRCGPVSSGGFAARDDDALPGVTVQWMSEPGAEADGRERLPGSVECATYYVVSEALANVAKYAQATHAKVAVRRVDGSVVVDVCDDGVGGADATQGSGLRGLADRVAALDGTLAVESPAGHGTRLHAEIPCAPPHAGPEHRRA